MRDSNFIEKHLFIIYCIVGFFAILMSKSIANQYLATAIACILIISYAYFVYKAGSRHLGDNIYYLGFIYTLISLTLSLISFSGTTEAIGIIISNFAIALWSTIWGLALRVWFNNQMLDPEDVERNTLVRLNDTANDLAGVLANTVADYRLYAQNIKDARDEAEDMFANSLKNISDNITNVLEDTLSEYKDTLDEVKTALVDSQNNYNEHVEETAKTAIDNLGNVTGKFEESLSNNADNLQNSIEKHVEKSSALDTIFDNYITVFNTSLEDMTKTDAPNVVLHNQMKALFDDLHEITTQIKDNRIIENTTARNTAENINQINATIKNFTTQIEMLAKSVQLFSSEVDSVTKPLEEIKNSIHVGADKIKDYTAEVEQAVSDMSLVNADIKDKLNKGSDEAYEAVKNMNNVLGNMSDYITDKLNGKDDEK